MMPVSEDRIYVEDQCFYLPNVEDGPMRIGDLWNCNDSSLVGNAFGSTFNNEHLHFYPRTPNEYTLSRLENTEDRFKHLKFKHTFLDILAGVIKTKIGEGHQHLVDDNCTVANFLCRYTKEAFKIDLRSSSDSDIFDRTRTLKEQLIKGCTKATHIVTSVVLGAEMNAYIDISTASTSNALQVQEYLKTEVPTGRVTSTTKKALEQLEQDQSKTLKFKIFVKSNPPTLYQPESIQDMFSIFENFDPSLTQKYLPSLDERIVGVPLYYLLTPITAFFDVKVEKLYAQVEGRLEQKLTDVLYCIKDLENGNILRGILFGENHIVNAVTNKTFKTKFADTEAKIKLVTQKFLIILLEQLRRYKQGQATTNDLSTTCTQFDEEINILGHISEMRSLTDNLADIANTVTTTKLLRNAQSKDQWLDTGENFKILLKANISTPTKLILKFIKAAREILGFGIGIYFQKLEESRTSLTIKVYGEQKCYPITCISYVLDLIAVATNKHPEISQHCFFFLAATNYGIQLPLTDNVDQVFRFIEHLLPLQNIKMYPTYWQTMSHLSNADNTYKFVVTLEAIVTAAETVKKLILIQEILNIDADYVVGTFSLSNHTASPVLIFRNGYLYAALFDNMDICILNHEMDVSNETKEPLLSVLTMNEIRKSCIYSQKGACAEHIGSIFAQNNDVSNSFADIQNAFPQNKNLLLHCVQNILIGHVQSDNAFVASSMINACITLNPELKKVFNVKDMSCTNNARISKNLENVLKTKDSLFMNRNEKLTSLTNIDDKWDEVIAEMISDVSWPKEEKPILSGLMESNAINKKEKILAYLQKCTLDHMNNIKQNYMFVLYNYLKHQQTLNQANTKEIILLFLQYCVTSGAISGSPHIAEIDKEPLLLAIKKGNLYQLVSLAFCLQDNRQLLSIKYELEKCADIDSGCVQTKIIQLLRSSTFDDTQRAIILKNAKVAYSLELTATSDFISELKKCLGTAIHLHLPEKLKKVLKEFETKTGNENVFDNVKSLNDLRIVFQEIVNSGDMPEYFMKKLRMAMENSEIQYNMLSCGSLLYWDNIKQIFSETWGVDTVVQSLLLMNKNLTDDSKSPDVDDTLSQMDSLVEKLSLMETNCDDVEMLTVCNEWKPLLGAYLLRITPENFLRLQPMQSNIRLKSPNMEYPIRSLLPSIIQRLKMWDIWTLQPHNLSKCLPERSITPKEEETSSGISAIQRLRMKKKSISRSSTSTGIEEAKGEVQPASLPLSKLDIITCVINSCSGTIVEDLLRIMSQFPISLPLIVPAIDKCDTFLMLTPWLQSINFKWETEKRTVTHNHLFTNPFRLIVAVRIGDAVSGKSGKSSILNQFFNTDHLFSSANEPGSHQGKPVSLPGFVEFVALSEETCTKALWNFVFEGHYKTDAQDVILLANLHGDALNYPHIVRLLSDMKSTFIVFLMEKELDLALNKLDSFVALTGKDVCEDLIVSVDTNLFEKTNVDTSKLIKDTTLEVLRTVFKNALLISKLSEQLPRNYFASDSKVSLVPPIETIASNSLIEFVKQKSCKHTKGILKLQNKNSRCIDDYESYHDIWNTSKELQNLVNSFLDILRLNLPDRRSAISHLHRDISAISAEESMECRREILSLKEKIRRTLDLEAQEILLQVTKKQLLNAYKTLDGMNLGTEHFFREIGRAFEIALCSKNAKDADLLLAPKLCAELLIDGTAIEILEGDIGDINTPWFTAICSQVHSKYPKLRVFVLSILGLQSSGKSTLLNALFGCKFAVSVGRCTKGLFMRLVFLDKTLVDRLGIDALILIDTEGLGAPEMMNIADSERKDRLMATFAMSVSDLTLINVLGESISSLTEILQIVIVTMARLDRAEMSPDIMMVQHVTERDFSKTMMGTDVFCQALNEAITLISKKNMELGTFECNSLANLVKRVKNGDVLKQFRAFKNGATQNSPPSEEYHKDVVSLYTDILESCRQSKKVTSFKTWYELLPGYWDEISTEKFALNFKNLQEMQDFISRGSKIAEVKQSIDLAFRHHRDILERHFSARTNAALHNKFSPNWEFKKETLFSEANENLETVPNGCNYGDTLSCKPCANAVNMCQNIFDEIRNSNYEVETESTINNYIRNVRHSVTKHLRQTVQALEVQLGKFCEFEDIINNMLKEKLRLKSQYDEDERKDLVEEIWSALVKKISDTRTITPVIQRIKTEISKTYHLNQNIQQAFHTGYEELFNKKGFVSNKNRLHQIGDYIRGKDYERVDSRQAMEMQQFLEALPVKILNAKCEEKFDNWMVNTLFHEMEEYMASFSAKYTVAFTPALKIIFHRNGIRLFTKAMEEKESIWRNSNDPLRILQNKEQEYKKQIDIRLQFGFKIEGEGQLMAAVLMKAIRKVAQTAGDRQKVDSVLGNKWIINSENVRLTYLSALAEQVNDGNCEAALTFFRHPKPSIDYWFTTKVNSICSISAQNTFKKVAKYEHERVSTVIKLKTTCKEVELWLLDYVQPMGIEYKCLLPFDNSSNAEQLKNIILKALEDAKLTLCQNIIINAPSLDETVMKRLGCTECCHWCGSLCWGERGHEEDAGDTKKHHTSHQPRGLHGTHHKNSKDLVCISCDKKEDNHIVYWGINQTGIQWKDAKNHPDFVNWNFGSHFRKQFTSLMRWFFFNLHKQIAEYDSLKPANADDLRRHGISNLQLQPILSEMQSTIN